MFEDYSLRAQHVVMLTRLRAGQRGAVDVDIEDLIGAIIAEDQADSPMSFGYRGKLLPTAIPGPKHRFFSPDLSNHLLEKVEALCVRSQPVPDASDMPLSRGVKHTFEAASQLRKDLQQSEVGSLHLLAAALTQHENKAVQILGEAGITTEMVLEAARTQTG